MNTGFSSRTIACLLIVLSMALVSCVNTSREVKRIRVNARVESISKEIELTSLPGSQSGYCMSIELKSPEQLRGVKLDVLIYNKFERKFHKKNIYPGDTINFDVAYWILNNYYRPYFFNELHNIEVIKPNDTEKP